MNIVFYILIGICAVIVTYVLSFLCERIGDTATKLMERFKNNITDDKENENE